MVTEENNSLEEIQAYFTQDKYATLSQCKIIQAKVNDSICEMPITPNHLNANGTVMGGAIFTLADFTAAVASNLDNNPSVAIDCTIRFFTTAKGTKLIAHCTGDRTGRSTGFYTVEITDDLGTKVASCTCTNHRAGGKK